MGHSSIKMTFDLYGHLFEDHEADLEAMKRVEAAVLTHDKAATKSENSQSNQRPQAAF